jgi:hypothetical protein
MRAWWCDTPAEVASRRGDGSTTRSVADPCVSRRVLLANEAIQTAAITMPDLRAATDAD